MKGQKHKKVQFWIKPIEILFGKSKKQSLRQQGKTPAYSFEGTKKWEYWVKALSELLFHVKINIMSIKN